MNDGMRVVFVLGGPGAGKGTQCALASERYGWTHLSTGELLRAEADSGSEQAPYLRELLADGGIPPVAVMMGLLRAVMDRSASDRFLLDGFPRTIEQAEAFEAAVCAPELVLFLDCPDDELVRRVLSRGDAARSDDTPETAAKRLEVFKHATLPVVEHYEAQGRVARIDSQLPVDDVAAAVGACLDGLLAADSGQATSRDAFEQTAPALGGAAADAAAGGDSAPEAPRQWAEPEALPALDPASDSPARVAGPVVIVGPSGVGKGTIIERLMREHTDRFGFSVSHTTRSPRPGEVDGKHYHFSNVERMQADIDAGKFVEYAHVHGNIYGTSIAAIQRVAADGKVAILDIDVQGARLVKQSVYGGTALFLFIAPPSIEELERRLRGRGTEEENKIVTRIGNAHAEIAASREAGFFDAVIVNDDLDTAYAAVVAAIERHVPGCTATPSSADGRRVSLDGRTQADSRAAQDEVAAGVGAAAAEGPPRVGARQYMAATVVPALREALRALNRARPADPLGFLAEFFAEASRTAAA